MRNLRITFPILLLICCAQVFSQSEKLVYHNIQTDNNGNIVCWYNPNPGISYNHIVQIVWNFWDTMRHDMNGLPYYMNHQVWNPNFDDPRGIGGDQLSMAMSSWRLLYAYTGNERIKENMSFIAGYNLTHGLSPAGCKWPAIPFPYNTFIYSGIYDGDMRAGKDVSQPDKAGSFGLELVHMYKIKSDTNFLGPAIKIANTLAAHIKNGDIDHSPLPFKVNVFTGKTALLRNHEFTGTAIDSAGYTSNWAPTMQLFLDLIELKKGNTRAYQHGFDVLLSWMKKYPIPQNKWGPFFEDVDWWSETQINAMTFARFMMEHPQYFPNWKPEVKKIIEWVHTNFNNENWKKYGVVVTNEQTVYPTPGESHTSRQGADELLYTVLSGDSSYYNNAVRQLNWATYAVDIDGKNCFPQDEPWLTDGYGDYVRHYLRAMASNPELTANEDHLIASSSVVQQADYKGNLKKFLVPDFEKVDTNAVRVFYRCFDDAGTELVRLQKKPGKVLLNNNPLQEMAKGEGYSWLALAEGGMLTVRRATGNKVIIME
jgi:hypothetical protein